MRRRFWVLVLALVASTIVTACDWAQFRQTADHRALTPDAGIRPGPRSTVLDWSAVTGGEIRSSPAVSKGVVYVGSMDGSLYAFDATAAGGCAGSPLACDPLWTATTGGPIESSPAVHKGSSVLVGSDDGTLYAFDATGSANCAGTPKVCTPLWTASTGGPVRSSPSFAGQQVYVGSDDGKLYAFDVSGARNCAGAPKVCTALWTVATGGPIESSPAVSNGNVYVGSDDGLLHAYDIRGNALWTAATGGAVRSSPAVSGSSIYVGSDDGMLHAFDVNGNARWARATGGPIESSPAVSASSIYVGSDDGRVHVFDLSGNEVWTAVTGAAVRSSPAISSDLVYVGSDDGSLYAFDKVGNDSCSGSPKVCSSRWSAGTGGAVRSSPAVSNRQVFVGSADGQMHAYTGFRPNFVVVLVDDLDARLIPYWQAMPKTRALIADQGLTFNNFFVPDPLCCPARATLLTGMYAHNTGVLDNTQPDGGYPAFVANGDENKTIGVRLQAGGYRTAFAGKYLNGYETDPSAVPPGWNEWFGLAGTFYDGYSYTANHNGVIESFGDAGADYQTDVLTREANSFLATTSSAQPFMLYLSPSAPHEPLLPPPRYQPNSFDNLTLPQPPNFNEADVSDKPTWLRNGVPALDQAGIDGQTSAYRNMTGSLLAVDDMVASVASTLKARHQLDQTVFVFTSDNGFLFGAHRLTEKMAPYEESIRVPFILAGPGIRRGTDDRMVTQTDLAPTLYQLANVPIPSDIDGRSLVPLLQGAPVSWRDDFMLEYRGSYPPFYVDLRTLDDVRGVIANHGTMFVPSYRALRTADRLYVEWYEGTEHEYELYDLNADPYELDNLIATPAGAQQYAAEISALQGRLETLAACAGATCSG